MQFDIPTTKREIRSLSPEYKGKGLYSTQDEEAVCSTKALRSNGE